MSIVLIGNKILYPATLLLLSFPCVALLYAFILRPGMSFWWQGKETETYLL